MLKNTIHKELTETIRAVHAGKKALSPEASYEIAEHATDDALTPAEINVLRLIAAGNANKQIADQLCSAERRVLATPIFNIRRRLARHRVAPDASGCRVRTGCAGEFTLLSDPPPLNVTIPAILLAGTGILLVAGLWTPIAGSIVALTETRKMLLLHGDKSG